MWPVLIQHGLPQSSDQPKQLQSLAGLSARLDKEAEGMKQSQDDYLTTSLASLGRGLETFGTCHSDGFAIRVPLKVNFTVGTSIARRSSTLRGSSNSIFGARLEVKAIPAKKSLACTSRRSSRFPKVNGA